MTTEPENWDAEFDALVRAVFGTPASAVEAAGSAGEAAEHTTVDEELLALFTPGRDVPPARAFELDDGLVTFVAEGEPELVGVRAAGLLDGQQVVVEAGELTVVLDVTRRGDDGQSHAIRGEVIGAEEVLAVQLLDGVVEVALAVTDEFGEFVFEEVPSGVYDLVVAGRSREVTATVTVL